MISELEAEFLPGIRVFHPTGKIVLRKGDLFLIVNEDDCLGADALADKFVEVYPQVAKSQLLDRRRWQCVRWTAETQIYCLVNEVA